MVVPVKPSGVVPAYGEDDEAKSLQTDAKPAAPLPIAPTQATGTTETDVAKNIAGVAARRAAKSL